MSRKELPSIIRGLTALTIVGLMSTSCTETQSTATPTLPSTRSEVTKIPELSTPTPTLIPFFPTETPSLSKNMIEIARRAQQEALARGEFKFPLPEGLVPERIHEIHSGYTQTSFLVFRGQEGKEPLVFPSLVKGEVLGTGLQNTSIKTILVKTPENNFLQFEFPAYGNFLVEKGVQVDLGKPLFRIKYMPKDPLQKAFAGEIGNTVPDGIIAIYYLSIDPNGNVIFRNLSGDNLLIGKDNKPMPIPILPSDESA